MYIFAYLRASTRQQDAERAKNSLQQFVAERGHRVASWYVENVSGASLQRPELMRLLENVSPGDAILIEQVDRLSRLDDAGWIKLKELINSKSLSIVSLDLPTSYVALENQRSDDFTAAMLRARHCCKVSDEAAFCLIQRPYISKTLLTSLLHD
uniref:recombinase family protein n=1 Tax=Salmonella enterica TaxID=28901 RepID=UPI001482B099